MNDYGFSPKLAENMRSKGIDLGLTSAILKKFNAGAYDHIEPICVHGIPQVDGKTVLDMTGDFQETMAWEKARERIAATGLSIDLNRIGHRHGAMITFDKTALARLGVLLYPICAFGVLNGGSASSYIDSTKNKDFDSKLFTICQQEFAAIASLCEGKAKGITPAFIHPDGTPGPSFMELKMRFILMEALEYQHLTGRKTHTLLPIFQMTSVLNDTQIRDCYRHYRESPLLQELIAATGIDVTEVRTGIQPMLAAFSHRSCGKPKTIFGNAFGQPDTPLPMPGGHGQNFAVLREVYRDLHKAGIRFAYLSNVDNLGCTVDAVSLALMVLRNKQAGFEFVFRTVVDVKGGILVEDQNQRITCAEIGMALDKKAMLAAEREGKRILFNCAVGLFNLDYLVPHLDHIIEHLPMRFSDQDKDAGKYSQAEQSTWEIIGMLDDFLIFGVDKYERFLAAKLLLEGLMCSGVGLERPDYPTSADAEKDIKAVATQLHRGLQRKLAGTYGMKLQGRRWLPKSIAELKA